MPTDISEVLTTVGVCLTLRERRLYRAILLLSTCVWVGVLLAYFIIGDRAFRATLFEVCLFAINTMVMFGFGYALRTDLRIIRGVPWLLEGPTDSADH